MSIEDDPRYDYFLGQSEQAVKKICDDPEVEVIAIRLLESTNEIYDSLVGAGIGGIIATQTITGMVTSRLLNRLLEPSENEESA